MKASELRIGNLVNYHNWNKDGKDCFFYVRDLFFEGDKICLTNLRIQTKVDFKCVKPIPLTEEWLLKFEFIKCDGKYGEYFKCSKLDGFRIWFNENEHTSWWSIGRKDYDNDDTILLFENCKTLHQLQNLYFALTSEELKIKESKS